MAFDYGSQALVKASKNDPSYKPIKELKQYENFINTFGKDTKNNMGKDKLLLQRSNELKSIEKVNDLY